MNNNIWLKTDKEMIQALIADEAKQQTMLLELNKTVQQLISKNKFRLALLHTINENKGK